VTVWYKNTSKLMRIISKEGALQNLIFIIIGSDIQRENSELSHAISITYIAVIYLLIGFEFKWIFIYLECKSGK